MMQTEIIGFTTWGRAAGPCGHLHAFQSQAERCLIQINLEWLKRAGIKSDRVIAMVRKDGGIYKAGKRLAIFRKV